ncbi:MAG: BON domain-containing protein [Candidatus Polarisedimenticolia bacterium]
MHRLHEVLSILAVVATISSGCSGAATEPVRDRTAGDVMSDAVITARLETTYLFNRHLSALDIDVETRDGIVTLNGAVPGDIQRDLAAAIARNVDGVVQVRDELRISDEAAAAGGPDRAFGDAVRDATVTASIKMALAFERGVRASDIDVDTVHGSVTLSGRVGSQAERQLAERIARDNQGVRDVLNRLEVAG